MYKVILPFLKSYFIKNISWLFGVYKTNIKNDNWLVSVINQLLGSNQGNWFT